MELLYSFNNKGGAQTRYTVEGHQVKATDSRGACAGYALIWAANMLSGESPRIPPTILRALLLQQKFEQNKGDTEQSLAAVVKDLGFSSILRLTGPYYFVIHWVKSTPGYCLVSYGSHMVGMGNNLCKKWYYFDSNEGLFETADHNDFYNTVTEDIEKNYKSGAGFRENGNKLFQIMA